FGDWPENATENRRTASLELIQLYLDRSDKSHAESQLIILSENLPRDAQLHAKVGDLFAKAGDDQRAFEQYRHAERVDPTFAVAIQGAGETAFRNGDFHTAEAYLTHSLKLDESNTAAKQLLAVIQSIFHLDPYARGISEAEKIQRTLRIFETAGDRLQTCDA